MTIFAVLALTGAEGTLWLDEAFSLAATRDLGAALEVGRGNMALYYLLADLWGSVSGSVIWLRLLSVVLMSGAVAGFTLLVRRQWDLRTARWAGVFAATTFGLVRYGYEARSYALVCLLVVGAWAALDRAIADPHQRAPWMVHGLCCLLLPLAHGLSVLQLAAQVAALAMAGVGPPVWRRAAVNFTIPLVILVGLTAFGVGVNASWMEPLTWDTARGLVISLFGPAPALALPLMAMALIGAAWAVAHARRRPRGLSRFRALMPVAWGLGSVLLLLLVSAVRPSQLLRYTVASSFGIALLLALAALELGRRVRRPVVPTAIVLSLLLLGQVVLHQPHPSGWEEATSLIAAEGQTSDSIFFATPDARLPFDAAWLTRSGPTPPRIVGQQGSLGSLDRVVHVQPAPVSARSSNGASRIWIVDQPYAHQADQLDAFLEAPLIRENYRPVNQWNLADAVTVYLLVRR